MAKALKEFDVVLVVRVMAASEFHAEGIGEVLVDHILETFNDDDSIVRVHSEPVRLLNAKERT